MKEIKRVVKPGGYVEFRDIDPMLKNMGPHTYKVFKHCEYRVHACISLSEILKTMH